MAWRLLSSEGKAFVESVREGDAAGSESFARSCVWADQVRDSTHRSTYEYHFINVDRRSTRINWHRDCPYDCVSVAVIRYAEDLAREPTTARARARRADALKFLGHFVADLHQPLHAGYADDLGGNRMRVIWNGVLTNLHAVWDVRLPRRAGLTTVRQARATAESLTPNQIAEWQDMEVFAWTQESYDVTLRAYGFASGEDLSLGYAEWATAVARNRIKMAAARLAYLIERARTDSLAFPPFPPD